MDHFPKISRKNWKTPRKTIFLFPQPMENFKEKLNNNLSENHELQKFTLFDCLIETIVRMIRISEFENALQLSSLNIGNKCLIIFSTV